MKSLYPILLLVYFNSSSFAQQKKAQKLEVINFKSKMLQHYSNDRKDNFERENKIAFFKNYILFEESIHHLKGSTFQAHVETIENGVTTLTDTSAPDMTIVKVTHMYYLYENGQKRGLLYNEKTEKTKSFSVDTLLSHSNLGPENEASISLDLGKPNEVKKTGKKWSEKYYNSEVKGFDTTFRYYDNALKDLPFSISKKLDQQNQSKLIKSVQLIKFPQSFEVKEHRPLKLEMIDEIELVTDRCPKSKLEKFQKLFENYEEDLKKNKVNPY